MTQPRRWTPEEIRAFVGEANAFARDRSAALVPLPDLLPAELQDPLPWSEQVAWVHVPDRPGVVAAWWEAIASPGEPVRVEFRSSRDGGRTWVRSEARYLNLLDHPDVGAVLIAHADLGPMPRPDVVAAGPLEASYETPTWIIQRLDAVGGVIDTQGMVEEVFGCEAGELSGRNVLERLHPADHDAAIAMWLEVVRTPGATRAIRQRVVRPDGTWVWLESTVMNQLEETGAVVATSHDVSTRHQQEAALRASEQEFRALAEGVPVAVFRAADDGRLTYANDRWHELVAPLGGVDSLLQLAGPGSTEALATGWAAMLTGEQTALSLDVDAPDGRVLRLRCRPVAAAPGEVVAVGTLDDVTAEVASADELRTRADHDGLTGLVNRSAFDRRLAEAISRQAGEVTLVFVDLDGFKVVNDTWGHDAGDLVLQEVAGRLRSVVRPGDVVARYGGDEFVLLCLGVTPTEDVAIAARITIALDRPIVIDGHHWRQAASVGVVRPAEGETARDALRRADAEMYRRKRR